MAIVWKIRSYAWEHFYEYAPQAYPDFLDILTNGNVNEYATDFYNFSLGYQSYQSSRTLLQKTSYYIRSHSDIPWLDYREDDFVGYVVISEGGSREQYAYDKQHHSYDLLSFMSQSKIRLDRNVNIMFVQ